ncbi:putative ribonuclease YeeF [Pseudovibrio sp. W64]|uniref:DNA/RNA non-specific endonuclease n=1 Tax=Pseudovibrio sp. W64 TaxID=1735583 RepID=UPI0007AE6DD6|nr:DNA/RNA non-specific endonuclease [Pseudovibrio sp. W64]KZK78995.1 putative ribonuclease YeeF [Pseudovibrio sp. W64]
MLKEDFGSSKRGDNATKIGKLGDPGDQGGHLAGHRFMGDTPDEGIAPQAGNLNQGAWKTMENEWADWIKKGYQVEYDIKVIPPGAVRPDAFDVSYKVVDPKTGKMRYKDKPSFENEAGETFDRIYFRDI